MQHQGLNLLLSFWNAVKADCLSFPLRCVRIMDAFRGMLQVHPHINTL